jgi:hypothetical protein
MAARMSDDILFIVVMGCEVAYVGAKLRIKNGKCGVKGEK